MAQLQYQSGFGNEFATEAHSGALPQGQNAPQHAPLGLVYRANQRHSFHRAAASEPPHLELPHPSFGDASSLIATSPRPR